MPELIAVRYRKKKTKLQWREEDVRTGGRRQWMAEDMRKYR